MAVVVYGRGWSGTEVLIELMERAGICPVAGVVDDNPELHGTNVEGINVLGAIEKLASVVKVYRIHRAVIAVGNNLQRKTIGRTRQRVD